VLQSSNSLQCGDSRTYDGYYDHREYVVHMAFLSWGGRSLSEVRTAVVPRGELRKTAPRSLQAVPREGVLQNDLRDATIDFKRAEMGNVQC
jgi:hypothetical protein